MNSASGLARNRQVRNMIRRMVSHFAKAQSLTTVPKTGKKPGHEPAHLALRGTTWHKSAPYI